MDRAKKLYRTGLQISFGKDLRITQLSTLLKRNGIRGWTDEIGLDQFASYGSHFNENSLAILRGITFEKSSDATFIRKCLVSLYERNLSTLKSKSVTGRSKDRSKEPISPEKMMVLENIFNERIEAIPNITRLEKDARLDKFKRNLAKVIYCINHSDTVAPRQLDLD